MAEVVVFGAGGRLGRRVAAEASSRGHRVIGVVHGVPSAPVGDDAEVVTGDVTDLWVWRDAKPKALRWGIFHAPGRLVHSARRRIVRIIENWPTTDVLADAYRRVELITRTISDPDSRHQLGHTRPNAGVWSRLTPTTASITGAVRSTSRNQRHAGTRAPFNRSRPYPQCRREEAGLNKPSQLQPSGFTIEDHCGPMATSHRHLSVAVCTVLLTSVLLTACSGASTTSTQAAHGATLDVSEGASHSMVAPFEGTNLDYSGVAEPYDKTSVSNAVASLAPGTIRYPGGAISNYWDWQTGSVNQPPSTTTTVTGETKTTQGRKRTYGFTLSTLKQLTSATGAVPIFDLNVMTSTLEDQLQMLRTAAQMGLPVRYVELGNEFYLSNSNYVHAFPTPASYADMVASWAPAIRDAFPNAQIAAVASVSTTTPREQSWNSTLLSIAGNDINAVTLHDYPGTHSSANTPPSPEALLAGASIEWQPVENIINSLPSQLSVWLTEYNLGLGELALGSPALGTTWEHGLYIAGLDMQELTSPRVVLTDYWDLFGSTQDAQFSETIPPVITPAGSASKLINQAMKGATVITVLSIAHDPTLDGSVQSVSGIKLATASGGDRIILVNLGSSAVTLSSGRVIQKGASVQQLSGPLSSKAVNVQSSHVSSDLTLPSYSVTVVSMETVNPASSRRHLS